MISYQQLGDEDWVEQKNHELNHSLGYVLLLYVICLNHGDGSKDKTEEIRVACHDEAVEEKEFFPSLYLLLCLFSSCLGPGDNQEEQSEKDQTNQ